MTPTIADLARIDARVQKLLGHLERSSLEVRLFKAEYEVRLIKVGDMIKLENGEIRAEQARKLPETTKLGPDAALALISLVEWVIQQMGSAMKPLN